MQYAAVDSLNREQANQFIRKRWFSTEMVIRGSVVDLAKADGIAAYGEKGDWLAF